MPYEFDRMLSWREGDALDLHIIAWKNRTGIQHHFNSADNRWSLSTPDIESLLTREAENIAEYCGPYSLVSGVFALPRGCTCHQSESLESAASGEIALHLLIHESRTGENRAPAHSHVVDSSHTREGVIRVDYESAELNIISSTSGGGPGYGAYEKLVLIPSASRATYQITTRRGTQPVTSFVL